MPNLIRAILVLFLLSAAAPAVAQSDGGGDEGSSNADVSDLFSDSEPDETKEASPSDDESAWRAYHRAFRDLARGKPVASYRGLMELREAYPDHPSAVFARPVLEMYRNRSELSDIDIPPNSEWRPTSEHPAVRDKSSVVYDPDWARYREAFVALAGRRENAASVKLQTLRNQSPDHPAAPLASEILNTLDDSDPMLVRSEEDLDGDIDISVVEPPSGEELQTAQGGDFDDFGTPIGWRVAGEGAGGLLGSLAGTLGGGTTGYLVGLAAGGGQGWVARSYGNWGMALGSIGALPAGVYVAGNMMGGEGDLLWTYVGGAAGTAGAFLSAFLSARAFLPGIGIITVPVFTLGGPILGYELSSANNKSDSEQATGPIIRPVATPHERTDTGLFGLDITF